MAKVNLKILKVELGEHAELTSRGTIYWRNFEVGENGIVTARNRMAIHSDGTFSTEAEDVIKLGFALNIAMNQKADDSFYILRALKSFEEEGGKISQGPATHNEIYFSFKRLEYLITWKVDQIDCRLISYSDDTNHQVSSVDCFEARYIFAAADMLLKIKDRILERKPDDDIRKFTY